ncbi:MAG: electron transport complex subunit RsxG [Thiobacillaceae bacterium]|nr:electron transport complex subunit RsxG [Thiobacillaceae bacterium]MCX7673918.1 electron transport complex subunit RsxG [Thiobacillaceae bacterium]MDW8322462.1 electron transport complex subunit RsxG [Burkholderiales bacterium]
MNPALRETLVTAVTLLAFAVVGSALLAATYALTRPQILASEAAERRARIAETLPAGSFDNDLVRTARVLAPDPLLGLDRPAHYYLATRQGQATAVVLEAVAPDGYSGDIRLLIGIGRDGRITGVRVSAHKETPGLGDYIEAAKSRWIHVFDGRSLTDPPASGWKVRKDGGQFDYMTGATVTPRAVVAAVHRALQYFEQHKDRLLAVPSHVQEQSHDRARNP